MKKRFFILLGLLLAAGAAYYFSRAIANKKRLSDGIRYTWQCGKTVVASGSVESVNEVDVGAQVSGKIHQTLCQIRARNQKRGNDR